MQNSVVLRQLLPLLHEEQVVNVNLQTSQIREYIIPDYDLAKYMDYPVIRIDSSTAGLNITLQGGL